MHSSPFGTSGEKRRGTSTTTFSSNMNNGMHSSPFGISGGMMNMNGMGGMGGFGQQQSIPFAAAVPTFSSNVASNDIPQPSATSMFSTMANDVGTSTLDNDFSSGAGGFDFTY
mmetsp:Transcript_9332/g.12532  ORF Transcript_9332/g.12532 Transcript_9332/m.12532 type:complete len:113 (-) Transcript_9332:95-433(-)